MTGWCQGDGYRVGFGEVTGQVLPARRSRDESGGRARSSGRPRPAGSTRPW